MKKRLLSFVLAVLMIASLLPATALAAGIVDSGTCGAEGDGSNLTWTLDSDGVLTISGSGDMYDYYSSSAPWHGSSSRVKSAVIADGVTSIGEKAFYKCESLTSVTIPDSVTSIGDSAFSGCTSLTSVTIPDSVTLIDNGAFSFCTSLTSVTIPDSVTSIGEYAFTSCTSLTGIWVAEGNSHYSSDASGVLFNKDKTTLVQCPGAFSGSYAIPDSVTSIGEQAFMGCTSLTSVTIPDSVTSIGGAAFLDCTSLTSVTIPNGVTSIEEHTFDYCTSLTSVTIPDSVTNIGEYAFAHCTSLTSVTIPDSVTSIGHGAFYYCKSLTSMTIPDSVTSIGHSAFESCKSLTSVTIPDSVTSIGARAFYYCTSLTSVTIPDSVTSIGEYAFAHCTSLTSVTIPDSVTSIGYEAFYNCRSLTSVTIPDSVTSIGSYAFSGCSSLTSVTIPDSVTSINNDAFYDCTSLTDVYYAGSEAQWKAISISSNRNDDLLTANIHYNYVSHTHSYKDVVTAPTCTEKGYTTHTCACGDSYVDTYVDALGHAWDNGKVTKEPTETETGVKTFTCTRCGETKTETIPATGVMDVTKMFTDVSHSWADDGIRYCVTHQLMSGIGNDLFGPKLTTTRAQIVQILYNLEGEPKVSGTTPFTDLTQDWYQDAVRWAYQTGVVAGTSSTTFEPDRPVTREQIAVILMEYVTRVLKLERTWTPADLSIFPDADSVSDWAKDAMADAVGLGLISGASNGGQTYLEPQGSATREQVATILMEFCKNVKK